MIRERLVQCDTCKERVDAWEIMCWETQRCEPCYDAWIAKQIALFKPSFDAEQAYRNSYDDIEDMGDF